MKTYICNICGYEHEEKVEGEFLALPDNWVCPICSAEKPDFTAHESTAPSQPPSSQSAQYDTELSANEMSIICSNLAKGCEKQYLPKESEMFTKLSKFFANGREKIEMSSMQSMLDNINNNIDVNIPNAVSIATQHNDRGALRALTWSGKVSMILRSIISRYMQQGEAMIENTQIYVCGICGFIYIGDTLPELCPVCKVTNKKFELIKGDK